MLLVIFFVICDRMGLIVVKWMGILGWLMGLGLNNGIIKFRW